jgi:hypothetical protein
LLGLGFGAPGTVDAANIDRAFITDFVRALLAAAPYELQVSALRRCSKRLGPAA